MQGPRPRITKELPMGQHSTVFDDLDAKFGYLITGPKPLALHGRTLGHGAPKRQIPLAELRSLLTEYDNWPLHDAVTRELIRRANTPTGDAWMVAIAWMLLPALRKASGELARGFPGDPADLDAEILAGLVTTVRAFGPCGERIAWHLVDKAQVHARRLRRREARAALGLPPTTATLTRPYTGSGSQPSSCSTTLLTTGSSSLKSPARSFTSGSPRHVSRSPTWRPSFSIRTRTRRRNSGLNCSNWRPKLGR